MEAHTRELVEQVDEARLGVADPLRQSHLTAHRPLGQVREHM